MIAIMVATCATVSLAGEPAIQRQNPERAVMVALLRDTRRVRKGWFFDYYYPTYPPAESNADLDKNRYPVNEDASDQERYPDQDDPSDRSRYPDQDDPSDRARYPDQDDPSDLNRYPSKD